MIVKYKGGRGYVGAVDPYFTVGKEYIALGMSFRTDGRESTVSILCDEDRSPVLIELAFFDIVDSSIPPNWAVIPFEAVGYGLRPTEFGGDFWDRFYDGDLRAGSVLSEVVRRAEKFHGWSSRPSAND